MPMGRSRRAETSAMESICRHNATMALCSGSRPTSATGTGRVATTREIRSNLPPVGSVRPRVIAYGRTTGPASASSQNSSTARSGEELAGPDDQHGHLVRDQSDVGLRRTEHREAGSVSGSRHEEEAAVHLDDGLAHVTCGESGSDTAGQALQPGGNGG